MKLVNDFSYWNRPTPEMWTALMPYMDGAIIRLSFGTSIDQYAQQHIDICDEFDKPYAGYHWADPTKDINAQLAVYKQAVDRFKPKSMWNDYEQWWSDWAAYMRGDYAQAYLTRISTTQLNNYYKKFDTSSRALLSIPVGKYSADWFINKYAPDMKSWVKTGLYWHARYLRYYEPTLLPNFYNAFGSPMDISHINQLVNEVPLVEGVGRQYESLIKIKQWAKEGYHLDWNLFTEEAFSQCWLEDVIIPEPPPDPEPPTTPPQALYKVVVSVARVRAKPNGATIWSATKYLGNTVVGLGTVTDNLGYVWIQTHEGYMGLSVLKLIQ